jgi:hypothetical protein
LGSSDPIASRADESAADEVDRLREARADESVLGVADYSTHATEVRDQRIAKAPDSTAVAVAKLAVRRGAEGGAVRPEPLAARESAVIGQVRPQVVEPLPFGCESARWHGGPDAGRDNGRRVPAELEIALGGELRVRGDDEAARDPELVRQCASRGKRGTGPQGAASDGVAQAALELAGKWSGRGSIQLDEHLRCAASSSRVVHEIAPGVDLNTRPRDL